MNTPERTVEEIYKQVRSNSRAILYTDLISLGIENERQRCGRDDMWAITTEELETLTQTLQAERQRCEEMVSRIATFAEHRATCFLYSCEDEEYKNSKCDCGLYQALTHPNNPK